MRKYGSGSFIPIDEENRDYLEYLAWLSKQEPTSK